MNWYVLCTKPKWEKKVAEQLQSHGINCYCPLVKRERQWTDRKKIVATPLFNSYVFVQIEEKDRNQVFLSSGVLRYLFWLKKPAIVRDFEINTIKEWLDSSAIVDVEISPIQIGDTICITSGPFAQNQAKVQEVTKTHYILILESMGCKLKMKH